MTRQAGLQTDRRFCKQNLALLTWLTGSTLIESGRIRTRIANRRYAGTLRRVVLPAGNDFCDSEPLCSGFPTASSLAFFSSPGPTFALLAGDPGDRLSVQDAGIAVALGALAAAQQKPTGRCSLGFDFSEYWSKPSLNIPHRSGRQSIFCSPRLACLAGSLPLQSSGLYRCDRGRGFRDLLLGLAFCDVSSASSSQ